MALRALLLVNLALGLLLLPGAVAAGNVQRSTDEQGTIHIGNPGPAGKEKAAEVSAPPRLMAPPPPMVPDSTPQEMPGRRSRQLVLREREEVFGRRVPPAPPPGVHQTPVTPAPPAQPEQPPPPGPPQGE